jgi:DNA-binding NarL/FixJ family response regulator
VTGALVGPPMEPSFPAGDGLRTAAIAASRAVPSTAPTSLRAVWRALVAGRFRLVEYFEQEGLRYYVLLENLDRPPEPYALDARERALAEAMGAGESEKAVAISLGVTPSAVSGMLKTTLLKLGLRSKIELVVLAGALFSERAAA